jgi:hypothetical protein
MALKKLIELAAMVERQAVRALVSHCASLARVDGTHGDVCVSVGISRQLDGGADARANRVDRRCVNERLRASGKIGHVAEIARHHCAKREFVARGTLLRRPSSACNVRERPTLGEGQGGAGVWT